MDGLRGISFNELRNDFYKERSSKKFKKKYENMFSTKKPEVVRAIEVYQEAYDRREELIMEGDLVLGSLVMANKLLFESDNDYDCPAVFIYTYKTHFEENPKELLEFALDLYDMRSLSEDELSKNSSKKQVADILNDEETPYFNIELPKRLTGGESIFMTTLIVRR